LSEDYVEEGKSTYSPIILAAGIALLLLGLVLFFPIAIAGIVGLLKP
jgi:hypothetical protein